MSKDIAKEIAPLLNELSDLVYTLERREEGKNKYSIKCGQYNARMIGSWQYFIAALIEAVPDDNILPGHILVQVKKTLDELRQEELMAKLEDD